MHKIGAWIDQGLNKTDKLAIVEKAVKTWLSLRYQKRIVKAVATLANGVILYYVREMKMKLLTELLS